VRKVYYNITVTSLSVAVALLIGTIELLQVLAATALGSTRASGAGSSGLDFGTVGYAVTAVFVLTWTISAGIWKRAPDRGALGWDARAGVSPARTPGSRRMSTAWRGSVPIGRGGMGSEMGTTPLRRRAARARRPQRRTPRSPSSTTATTGPAYGLALRVLRDGALAQDAVQEGFLAVWRNAGKFEDRTREAEHLILTLVHRRAVDLVRRETAAARRAARVGAAGSRRGNLRRGRASASAGDASRRPSGSCRSWSASRSSWRYYGGMDACRSSPRAPHPIGTVKSRMFSGLRRLRDLLGEAP
jgi:RNA polymerase sigma-70 factor (ECF subfamily)